MRLAGAAMLLAGALGLLVLVAGDAAGRAPGKALIAFSSGGRIFTVAADGSGRQALTKRRHRFQDDSMPAWSPDGSRIAFVRERQRSRIYALRTDGPHVRQLTTPLPGNVDLAPAYSRDATRFAFIRWGRRSHRLVSLVMVSEKHDGSPAHAVYRLPALSSDGRSATRLSDVTFSPDGARLLLSEFKLIERSSGALLRRSLYSMPATEGEPTLVANHASSPSFSPSGARIAYISEADHHGTTCYEDCSINGELYVANADGSNPRRLTHTKADEESPDWSADGRYIVFSGQRRPDGRHQLEVVPPDGDCAPVKLTSVRNGAFEPDWQPDAALPSYPGVCGVAARPSG